MSHAVSLENAKAAFDHAFHAASIGLWRALGPAFDTTAVPKGAALSDVVPLNVSDAQVLDPDQFKLFVHNLQDAAFGAAALPEAVLCAVLEGRRLHDDQDDPSLSEAIRTITFPNATQWDGETFARYLSSAVSKLVEQSSSVCRYPTSFTVISPDGDLLQVFAQALIHAHRPEVMGLKGREFDFVHLERLEDKTAFYVLAHLPHDERPIAFNGTASLQAKPDGLVQAVCSVSFEERGGLALVRVRESKIVAPVAPAGKLILP